MPRQKDRADSRQHAFPLLALADPPPNVVARELLHRSGRRALLALYLSEVGGQEVDRGGGIFALPFLERIAVLGVIGHGASRCARRRWRQREHRRRPERGAS